MENSGAAIDEELVNRVFRAVHSIKGGAGFFDLVKIHELAHRAEDVLALIRSRKVAPDRDQIGVLLRATDTLSELVDNPHTSNQADLSETMAALGRLCAKQRASPSLGHQPLWILLVEDDFASRLLLQTFLARYGVCHVAVSGREAVEAVREAFQRGRRYDLICMDIMMPEMDGREAVRHVRSIEESHGILSTAGAKIVMVTTVHDIKEVIHCFRELCDAYLIKPIDLGKLLGLMKGWRLVDGTPVRPCIPT